MLLSNQILVLHIKRLHIKAYATCFCSLLNMKNDSITWVYFSVYCVFLWGYRAKKHCQKYSLQKEIKKGGWLYRCGIVYGMRFKIFEHYNRVLCI